MKCYLVPCFVAALLLAGYGLLDQGPALAQIAKQKQKGGSAPSRKSVTVYAGSEGEAFALAERQNAGWRAVSARKVAPNDKLSRQWAVNMEK